MREAEVTILKKIEEILERLTLLEQEYDILNREIYLKDLD